MKKRIVIASSNENKVREYREIFALHSWTVIGIKELLGFVPKIIEDKKTIKENAIKKALEMSSYTEEIIMSDDTGLEIESLENKPGVLSARYAGENASAQDNINKVLKNLKGKNNRKAQFLCFIVFAQKDRGLLKCFKGKVKGTISKKICKGKHGFGYDPIFIPKNYPKTFSQLTKEEKNKISHRHNALKKIFRVNFKF